MDDMQGMLYKHSMPTRYDIYPRLTLWNARITNEDGTEQTKWFAQMGSNGTIDWRPMGAVLEEKMHRVFANDPMRMHSLFKLMFAFENDLR